MKATFLAVAFLAAALCSANDSPPVKKPDVCAPFRVFVDEWDGESQGETHHDEGYLSYDRGARKFVLHQFQGKGFVNHYVKESISEDGRTPVFVPTAIENTPAGWRGRETHRFTGNDEFTETFELAEPGKDFAVYSKARFMRKS